ncbi:uncharacterized protein LOC131062426 [Cryptomeria japonica]|uniref:uncharacterized protein LOC131062426 n=1 Tax=Cryptomeria japonica TaxID=3369 RepID=UPI0025ABFBD3|nr:uncharacterized protein LOC131062426 [Cryptomeria japonica]
MLRLGFTGEEIDMSVENNGSRRTHTPPGGPSTFDLFSWSEEPPENAQVRTPARATANADSDPAFGASPVGRPTIRMHQPAGGTSTISFGEQITPEEAQALLKRKPCSESKKREMNGSGIFTANAPNEGPNSANGFYTPDRPSVRLYQQAAGTVSQISFGVDGSVSPKKPTSLTEVAKQKELSGSQELAADVHVRRQCSQAKSKELSGNDIFGPPPELPPRSLHRNLEPKEDPKEAKDSDEPVPRNVRTSVKVSNPAGGFSQIIFGQESAGKTLRKVHDQKVAELTGNNIFKGDTPVVSAEKPLSVAKLKEMSGSDIFADEKPVGRDCLGGIRKPPGGESTIALV